MLLVLAGCRARANETVASDVPASHAVPMEEQRSPPAREERASSAARTVPHAERTFRFDEGPFGRVDVVVRVPLHPRGSRVPVLLAFHGRGETLKGPERGARGWLDDYHLERAVARLAAPPLAPEDFLGAVHAERLRAINEQLDRRPFRDFAVVMPYLPDVLSGARAFANGPLLTEFVLDQVLPRLASELPLQTDPAHLGIDGVSLGGRAALLIGLLRPAAFATLGATQPAIDASELERLVRGMEQARARNPNLAIRLLTSEDDYYRAVVVDFSRRLRAARVEHRLDVVRGNHGYDFNRGPGAIEMLLFHSEALWR